MLVWGVCWYNEARRIHSVALARVLVTDIDGVPQVTTSEATLLALAVTIMPYSTLLRT